MLNNKKKIKSKFAMDRFFEKIEKSLAKCAQI